MTLWQQLLMWSGAVLWAVLALGIALAVITRLIKGPQAPQPKPFNPGDYTWVYDPSGQKPPVRVPNAFKDRAMRLLMAADAKELNDTINGQYTNIYTVPAANIRAAMMIAQQEPDIEMAMATWLANYIQIK